MHFCQREFAHPISLTSFDFTLIFITVGPLHSAKILTKNSSLTTFSIFFFVSLFLIASMIIKYSICCYFKELIIALKSIGNIGYEQISLSALSRCISTATNSIVKITAIDALRRKPCSDTRNSIIEQLYNDQKVLFNLFTYKNIN